MDTLKWQEIDRNDFAKFIRDISANKNNIKHMLEDYENEKNKSSKKNDKKNDKKPL